jgi:hypothetical protein
LVRQFLPGAGGRPETSDRNCSGKDNGLKKLLQLAGWPAILAILALSVGPSGAAKTCVAKQILREMPVGASSLGNEQPEFNMLRDSGN